MTTDKPISDDQLADLHLRADFLGESLDPVLAMRLVREVGQRRAEIDELHELRIKMTRILVGVANAIHGEPTGDTLAWSWADLPERVAALVAELAKRGGQ